MRVLRPVVFAALAAVVAGPALAQPPGGGPGGFGGGGVLGLLQSKTVREDVKVTDDQAAKLKDWQREYAPKMREMMQEKMQGVDRSEMREKLPAIMAEISKETYKELATVLDSKQIKRLKQVELQVGGLQALASPDTSTALKLTDDQKEKLKGIGDDVMKEMRDLGEEYGTQFGRPPADADKAKEFAKKAGKITKDATDKAMALMTDDQKKAHKDLTGDPIDVAKVRAESAVQGKKKKKDD